MKQIALKNFRKFQEFPGSNIESGMLDLNDITILVGRNNAGKSTLVKALILIVENLTRSANRPFSSDAFFTFRSDNLALHIDTFARAINNQTDDRFIEFSFGVENFSFTIEVEEANDDILYGHLQGEEDATAPIRRILVEDRKRGIKVDIFPYLQHVYVTIDRLERLQVLDKEMEFKMLKEELDMVE